MISKPTLRVIVGALACVLCGAVAAQGRYESHEPGGEARGGFGTEMRAGAPMGRPTFERGEPGMGRGPYQRPGVPVGRGPDRYPGYPLPYAAPPRYASPPPRRPYDAPPGWRAAPRQPPGIEGPRPAGAIEGPPRMASLGWVIESIKRRSPGRQLDADVDFMDGRPVYRVRWLTVHGRRMDYLVDAESGVILSGR